MSCDSKQPMKMLIVIKYINYLGQWAIFVIFTVFLKIKSTTTKIFPDNRSNNAVCDKGEQVVNLFPRNFNKDRRLLFTFKCSRHFEFYNLEENIFGRTLYYDTSS